MFRMCFYGYFYLEVKNVKQFQHERPGFNIAIEYDIDDISIIQLMSKVQQDAKSQGSRKSGKLHSAIEKAQAIQQREQLRGMILDKFTKDFGKGNKNIIKVINDVVSDYFSRQKITEESLRVLKTNVSKAVEDYRRENRSEKSNKSEVSRQDLQQRRDEDKKSNASSKHEAKSQKQGIEPDRKSQRSGRSGATSETSSVASKSVYQVEGDDQDEWATLVKFDTELFKKEKELERMREEEFKKKIKKELDKQLQDKKRRKEAEKNEESQYHKLQVEQCQIYDQRQKDKNNEYHRKIMLEKKMRDKQVKDENKRKKNEKKKDDQLDQLLVQKIKDELTLEEQEMLDRKMKERNRFQQIMAENEENQRRLRDEAERQRIEDIKAQEEYARLQDELEKKREEEKREREDKIKAVMASFADSVIKDQKEQIRAEDEKMMKHIENQLRKEKDEEERRKRQSEEQKRQMRQYLARQVEEKRQKEIDEKKIDEKQAVVWKEDTEAFNQNESSKQQYLKDVYKKHEEVLLAQMADKDAHKNRKKMNTLELLYNKALMKAAAEETDDNIKKAKV